MPQLSYNTVNNKRNIVHVLLRPVLVIVLIALVYLGGYVTPGVRTKMAQRGAEAVAKSFIVNATEGNYQAALDLGDDFLKQEVETPESLKELLGNIETKEPTFGDKYVGGDREYVSYTQIVSNLPETEGSTEASFNMSLVKVDDNWKVTSVIVENIQPELDDGLSQE